MKTLNEYINNIARVDESVFDNNIVKNDKIALTIQVLAERWANYKPNKTDGSKDAFGNPMKPGDILLIMVYTGHNYNPAHKQVFDLGVYISNDGRLAVFQSITGTDFVITSPADKTAWIKADGIDIYSLYKLAEKDPKKYWYSIPFNGDATSVDVTSVFGKITPNKIINLSALGMNIDDFKKS